MSEKNIPLGCDVEDFEAIGEAHCVHRRGIAIFQAVGQCSAWSRKCRFKTSTPNKFHLGKREKSRENCMNGSLKLLFDPAMKLCFILWPICVFSVSFFSNKSIVGNIPVKAVELPSLFIEFYQADVFQDLCPGRYNGPMIAGKVVADYFEGDREKKKIMDIAAGTGFVAEQLKTHGFVHIDALEPSSKMLLRAKEKGLYEDFYTEYLCDVPLPIPNDTYDCAVTSGGMGEGHIPCSGIPELIRIVKPGGIICIVMREVFLRDVDEYKDRMEPLMDSLEKEGKWKKVSRVIVSNYFINITGVVFLYRVI